MTSGSGSTSCMCKFIDSIDGVDILFCVAMVACTVIGLWLLVRLKLQPEEELRMHCRRLYCNCRTWDSVPN